MNLLKQVNFLLRITRTHGIVRRYFVVNGFDGALTMLDADGVTGMTGHAPVDLAMTRHRRFI